MEIEILDPTPVISVTTDISEIHTSHLDSRKEKEMITTCSSRGSRINNSNQLFQRKKILHPIHVCNPYRTRTVYGGSYHPVPSNAHNHVSSFTQRIMSAKLLRVKQLQNQLAETQSQLNDLVNENRLLKALQKRQDNALKKYEGSQEQLPQLLKTHNEDMRVLQAKYKQAKVSYRELENKLKQRDAELNTLKQQHNHLLKLSKDKHLGDRDKLTKKLQSLESTVQEQQEKIQMLNRKLSLESKNYRHQLNVEVNKHKETQKQLNAALSTVQSLKMSADTREKGIPIFRKKLPFSNQPSGSSHVSLAPPRVSIRQPSERLIQSETSLGLGNTGTASNSSISNMSFPSHISHDSSHDDGSLSHDNTLVCDRGNDATSDLPIWKSEHLSQDKSGANHSSSDEEDSDERQGHEKENSQIHSSLQSQKTSRVVFEPHVARRPNSFVVGKLSNVGARRKLPDRFGGRNRGNPVVGQNKEKYLFNTNFGGVGKEENVFKNVVSTPSSSSSLDKKSLDGSGNVDLCSDSSPREDEMNKNPKSIEPSTLEKELQELLENASISEKGAGISTEKTEENVPDRDEVKSEVDLLEKISANAMSDIDRLVEEACKGMAVLEGTSDLDLDLYKDLSWDELRRRVKPSKDEILDKLEATQAESADSPVGFGANEKADLLEALDEIDRQEKVGGPDLNQRNDISEVLNKMPVNNGNLPSPKGGLRKGDLKSSCQSKFDKKKKSNIMKELFGEKPEMLGQS